MKRNLTHSGTILQVLDRSFGLSRAQLAGRMNESREAIRKPLKYMLEDGRITRMVGDDGVELYNVTEKGKQALALELSKAKKETTSVIKPSPAPAPAPVTQTKTNEAWATLVEEAEQRGFAKGYSAGVQESQRAAYEDGRKSIINKLAGMLL